jgi:hypothetical protein
MAAMASAADGSSIGDLAAATGVAAGTLRMAASVAALRVALAVAGGTVAQRGGELLEAIVPRLAADAETAVAVANRAIGYLS